MTTLGKKSLKSYLVDPEKPLAYIQIKAFRLKKNRHFDQESSPGAVFQVDVRATDGPPFDEQANASQKMQAKPRFSPAFSQRLLEKCRKALFQG